MFNVVSKKSIWETGLQIDTSVFFLWEQTYNSQGVCLHQALTFLKTSELFGSLVKVKWGGVTCNEIKIGFLNSI